jgi:hypothetical protein
MAYYFRASVAHRVRIDCAKSDQRRRYRQHWLLSSNEPAAAPAFYLRRRRADFRRGL